MRGLYYFDSGEHVVLVPYVFVAKMREHQVSVSFSPDCLERINLALLTSKEEVEENLRLGKKSLFEIGEFYIRRITNSCFRDRESEAFYFVKEIALSVV
jgi:hypothetical protein